MKGTLLMVCAILAAMSAACAGQDMGGKGGGAAFAQAGDAEPRHAVCVAGKTLRGCCSWNTGIKGVTRTGLLCMNDAYSPTCSAEINQLLNGCCSGNGGFGYVSTRDGAVICRNNKQSPSCKVAYHACSNDDTA